MDTGLVEAWGEGEPVLLIHGSGAPAPISEMWTRQRPLAERYRLMILTRRGYGDRPVVMQTDVEGDVQDVLSVLGASDGAHLVGFSYGGIVSMVAAAQQPELVRSLTVIEPPALGVVRGNAAADAQVDGLSRFEPPPLGKTPEEFWADFRRLMGQSVPEHVELSPIERKAVEAHMAEAPPWTITIPLGALAAASFPKLVVSGDWNPAMNAVADIITERLSAERFVLKGWYHNIHRAGEPFNQRLDAFLQQAIRLRSA
ncbi:MAG TPA: alpha/beta hydrolase [Ktedonobacterales bacterium]|nr:alpha/beta hydrolase [Ktedonobacterales bacterium]